MATRPAGSRTTPTTRTALAAAAATVLVLLAGCSSSSDDGGGSDAGAGSAAQRAVSGSAEAPAPAEQDAAAGSGAAPAAQVEAAQVIATGEVHLRAEDVGAALFDVRGVVAAHRGTLAEDDTQTDRAGEPVRSRMVLRVPTAQFSDAMAALEQVATLVSSTRESTDVTTEVLDVDVRVEAQKRSIARIQALYDRAETIGDVVSLEAELSRRQADLASLEAQQRYLADQTSLSTITVSVERTAEPAGTEPDADSDDAGFLAGLSGGWSALRAFLVGAATVLGALLPWAVLVLVLGVPGVLVLRRLRRLRQRPGTAAPTL